LRKTPKRMQLRPGRARTIVAPGANSEARQEGLKKEKKRRRRGGSANRAARVRGGNNCSPRCGTDSISRHPVGRREIGSLSVIFKKAVTKRQKLFLGSSISGVKRQPRGKKELINALSSQYGGGRARRNGG